MGKILNYKMLGMVLNLRRVFCFIPFVALYLSSLSVFFRDSERLAIISGLIIACAHFNRSLSSVSWV